MNTIRLDIEYEGTGFAGWAKQPGLASIEGSLEQVLEQILQEKVSLSVAGRTDAGVHARGQVASFQTSSRPDPGRLRRSANQLLPPAIAIMSAMHTPTDFDARRAALSRTYSYSVLNREYPSPFRGRYVYHYRGRLDRELLQRAGELILGRHDFTAFTPTVTEHSYFEREITRAEWVSIDASTGSEGLLEFWITSSGFLRNMVRVLVGTMLEIARGRRPLDDLGILLAGASRPSAGQTAPSKGLCLESVKYPDSLEPA
ncbi:MAG: tRNA pseudouridine(38-40) synthase TruA [Thermoleophilia bacterium]|jgi:tRNA pseudouridine38-40 synthase